MHLREYLLIFWRYLWLVALCTTLLAAAAYLQTSSQPATYRSKATVLVGRGVDISNPSSSDFSTSAQLAQTYMEIAKRRPILEAVIQKLGISDTPASIAGNMQMTLVRGTQLMEILVTHPNPTTAAAIANEVAQQLIEQSPQGNLRSQEEQRVFIEDQLAEIQDEITNYQADAKELEATFETLTSELDLEAARVRLDVLRSRVTELQANYAALAATINNNPLNKITIVEQAAPAAQPSGPATGLNTLLGALAGLVIGLACVILIIYLDNSFKTPDRVESILGLPTLGMISRLPQERDEVITISQPRAPFSEAYRVLRANMQFAAVGRRQQTVLVTSPSPREGKSTTASNLAVAIAQAGHKVILVDTDLRRPRQHQIFKLPNQTGLTTAITQPEVSLSMLLKPTAAENLWVLTSGPLPPNPAELLGSERMAVVIHELLRLADLVIFDSPPLLAVADAAVLAAGTDATILVVDAHSTKQQAAKRAIEQLRQANANVVGVALNQISDQAGYYYYYYYASNDEGGSGNNGNGTSGTAPRKRRASQRDTIWQTIRSLGRS
jgi:capsular exopolysaccharide synthesis family protein